jgi:hypothetical protein
VAWTVEYIAELKLVRVTSQGRLDLAELRQLTRDAVAAGRIHATARFLVDHRAMEPDLGTTAIFDMPQRVQDLGFGPDFRIAMVAAPDSPKRADFEFYAIQCGNVGLHFLRLFFDYDAALEWATRPR